MWKIFHPSFLATLPHLSTSKFEMKKLQKPTSLCGVSINFHFNTAQTMQDEKNYWEKEKIEKILSI